MRDIRHKIERPSTIVIVSPVADLVFMVIVLMQLYEPPVCTGTVATLALTLMSVNSSSSTTYQ